MAFGSRVGADRPPQAAEPTHDFLTVKSRLRELRKHYLSLSRPEIAQVAYRTIDNLSDRVLRLFGNFGGENSNLVKTHSGPSSAEQAYLSLKETARITESNGDRASAAAIRQRLGVIDEFAGQQLQAFCDKHNVAATSLAPALPQSPPKAAAKVPIQAIDPRNLSLSPFDWVKFYRQLDQVSRHSDALVSPLRTSTSGTLTPVLQSGRGIFFGNMRGNSPISPGWVLTPPAEQNSITAPWKK